MRMPIPDYEFQARSAAKVLGSRLIGAPLDKNTTLYGWVEFAQWSAALPDRGERLHWYEVRFVPLGKRSIDNWISMSSGTDLEVNRLHFSVLERSAAHPEGAASMAKLGPVGNIRTAPKSIGLGTYLRDQLIDWVANLHPDASVAKGSLSSVDAGSGNIERRTRFYKGGNFEIHVGNDGLGEFWADRLDGLRRHTENGKVVELAIDEVQRLFQSVPELELANRQMKYLLDECSQLQTTKDKALARIFWAKVGAVAVFMVLLIATTQGKVSWHLF